MKKFLLLLFSLSCLFNTSFSQTQEKLLDSLFSTRYSQHKFNGNVLIAENGVPLFEKSYGKADEASGRLLNPQSVFELASVSKQFTAMGIVLLQKQGKLKYDDQISKYIPELAFYGNITIRNLLNHTGGLADYMSLFEKKWDRSKIATNEDIIKEFAVQKPDAGFKPNEKFEYSNTGYALLGSIIERVSKKSYGDYLKQHIFVPLKMTHTLVYRSRFKPQKIDNYALGYVQDSNGKKVLPDSFGKQFYTYFLDGIVGDGMVNSTLEDLLKWDQALYTDKLADSRDKEQIFTGTTTADGKNNEYGFGWSVSLNKKYGTIVSHSGGWAGYLTYIERQLDNNKTIIILQNNDITGTSIPIAEVRGILYNEKVEIENLKKINLSTEAQEKYTGIYASPAFPMKLKILIKDGELYGQGQSERQGTFKLDAYEHNIFKNDPAKVKVVFNLETHTMEFTQGKNPAIVFNKEITEDLDH